MFGLDVSFLPRNFVVACGTKGMVIARLLVGLHFLFLKSNHAFALLDGTLEHQVIADGTSFRKLEVCPDGVRVSRTEK